REHERRLRASEQRFRAAFDHAGIGMALTTIDGDVVSVNAALHEMLGYDEPRLVGADLHAVVHPDDLATGRRRAGDLLAGRAAHYTQQARLLRRDGGVVLGRVTGTLLRDADDGPQYVSLQVEDVTAAHDAR